MQEHKKHKTRKIVLFALYVFLNKGDLCLVSFDAH
jgi:hypothetical protein